MSGGRRAGRFPEFGQIDHALRAGEGLRPVREHDACDAQARQSGVECALGGDIEVTGGLVQQMNFSANQDLQIFGIHQRM